MSILIQSVRVSGFRGLKNVEVKLDQKTLLMGVNNSGKTSFLKALQVAFGDTRFVVEDDFYIGAGGTRSTEMIVDVYIIPTDDDGAVTKEFERLWRSLFRTDVQNESGQEFVAIRTRIPRKDDTSRFYPRRIYLKEWPGFANWTESSCETENSVPNLVETMPFLFQDAQRDILEDVGKRNSFLGRALAKVEYNTEDMRFLKEIIDALNKEAVEKSDVLKVLQRHLGELDGALGGEGKTEITSVAKDVRDLAKGIRLNYQNGENSFAMEYHGMGTRSWASLLALKAFAKIVEAERLTEKKPFFPILALEEPEAHLHPNAQKQLYRQITDFPGQVVVSTHSPYIAAQAQLKELRSFYRDCTGTQIRSMNLTLTPDENRRIVREVIENQGEILFAKVILLQEGQTEKQFLPRTIEGFFGYSCIEAGVTIISVGGYSAYSPFLKVAKDLGIPVIVYSDNDDARIRQIVSKTVFDEFGTLDGINNATIFLDAGNNLERQLVKEGFQDMVIEAFIRYKLEKNPTPQYAQTLREEYAKMDDISFLKRMETEKTSYSHYLGDVFMENPLKRPATNRFPKSILTLCQKLESWGIMKHPGVK
ncbi:MAG TPA: AAA family ATPase [Candidatus Deferrimicrobium sp.]|nr:AAA family ATPase [Candidatus Deferrimicrobium sp.]